MSHSLPKLILIFSLLAAASNRIHVFSVPPPAQQEQGASQSQTPELREAEELSLQVIELYKKGKYDEALPLAQRVLALKEKALGAEHLSLASALTNLAEIYLAKDKRKEAKSYYQRAIAIQEKNPGADKSGAAVILERYICLLTETKQTDEANDVRKQLFKLENGFAYDETSHKALSLPKPIYLEEAKRLRLKGSVVMKVLVDETGKVSGVKPLCGHPLLVQGAQQAVWNARFQPLMASGQPVKMIDVITYHFVIY